MVLYRLTGEAARCSKEIRLELDVVDVDMRFVCGDRPTRDARCFRDFVLISMPICERTAGGKSLGLSSVMLELGLLIARCLMTIALGPCCLDRT